MFRRIINILLCLVTGVIGISACAPITTLREDGSSVKHYFGYLRVITPPTASPNSDFNVMEISTYGVRFVNGIGIGYFHERNEYIPLDCRLVIRVANKQQLKDVLNNLSFIEKEGLCVTVSP